MKRRKVSMSVLPGEPTDGSGRVCIHLVVRDPTGPFIEPHVLHMVMDEDGKPSRKLEARPTRCRLACDKTRRVAPVTRNGVINVTARTDDPRAVTCPKCIESDAYRDMMAGM